MSKKGNLKFSNTFLLKLRDLGKQMAPSTHVPGLSGKSDKTLNCVREWGGVNPLNINRF